MCDDLDPVWDNIITFYFLLMSCQYGKWCPSFTLIVSHFSSSFYILWRSPPWLIFPVYFKTTLVCVPWDNIFYRSYTDTCIQISIICINKYWITDTDQYLFDHKLKSELLFYYWYKKNLIHTICNENYLLT